MIRDELINIFSSFGITNNEKADMLLYMTIDEFFVTILNYVKEYYNNQNLIRKQSNEIYTSQAYTENIPVILFLNKTEMSKLKKLKIPFKISNPNPDYIGVVSININAGNARKLLNKL